MESMRLPLLANLFIWFLFSIYFSAKVGINTVDFTEICIVPSYDGS